MIAEKVKPAGLRAQDEQLRKHVLEQLGEKIRGAGADPLEFLGVHEAVKIAGKGFGGGNSVKAVAEKLRKASERRVKANRTPVPLKPNLNEGEINLIARHADLQAEFERLNRLTKGLNVPQYQRLPMSPGRLREIAEELERLAVRKVGDMQFDVFEAWFRKRHAQVADLTLAARVPYHMFKSKVYKTIVEEMLPGYKVIAFDIKPLANGTYLIIPIK